MYSKYLFDSYFKRIDTHINLSIICNNPNSEAVMCLDGYKHSMVQIIALALASKTAVIIDNPPLVIDTHVFVALINELGGKARIINEKLILDMRNICVHTIPYRLAQFIHGSMYLCPALLCALGEFNYYGSGGCRIGNSINSERPIAHIISVMREFGAVITCNQFGYHGLYIEKLDGMFAICIIDLLKGKVFAVRDKQGIKPLYYYEDEYAYILASELKAIRAVYPLEINPLAIEMYLSFRFIPAPYSIYDKVSKLKAGEQITFYRDGEISKKCYVQYNTDFSQRQFNADECRNV